MNDLPHDTASFPRRRESRVLILLGFDFGGSDLAGSIGAFLQRDQQIAQY
jgi:hypothetical protein